MAFKRLHLSLLARTSVSGIWETETGGLQAQSLTGPQCKGQSGKLDESMFLYKN